MLTHNLTATELYTAGLLPLVLGKHDVPEVTQCLPVWSTSLLSACMNPVQEGLSNGPISSSRNSPINDTPTHI